LAVLGKLDGEIGVEEGLSLVIEKLLTRLRSEAPPDTARKLITAAYWLSGLRVNQDIADALFRRISDMGLEESTTYQAVMQKGASREGRRMLLRMGRAKWGPASDSALAAIESISDLDRLEMLGERLLTVDGWDELLAAP
jgi:hypothetical protein